MYNDIMTIASQLTLLTGLSLIGVLFLRQEINTRWFLFALSLYVINEFMLTRGFGMFPIIFSTQWNWEGKLYALAITLAIASHPQFGWKSIGLTWHQGSSPLPAYILVLVLMLFFFGLAFFDSNGTDNIETIMFQWSMPGLEEETFYRGTLLLAMNEAFRKKSKILGAEISFGGVLTTFLFGFGHAVSYGTEGLGFDLLTFMITGVPAFLLLWLRERTGSIILPILGHNVANGAVTLF